jgi:large subunit ribosomal protein L9
MAKIILTHQVPGLGEPGDILVVKDGYARNYLIPEGKALRVTKASLELFEARKAELEKRSEESKKVAESVSGLIGGKSFVIIRQAGDTGHLYGSVSTRDVSAVLKEAGADVDYTKIAIDTPVKELGIYSVKVALHPEIVEVVKINVARSEAEAKVAEEKALLEAQKAAEKKARKEAAAEEPASEDSAEVESAESAMPPEAASDAEPSPEAEAAETPEAADEAAAKPVRKSSRKKAAVEEAAADSPEAEPEKTARKRAAKKKEE